MAAYVLGEAEITDPVKMKAYGPVIMAAVAKFGGKYLTRGVLPEVFEGPAAHRMFIIEFKDADTARAWFASPDYAADEKAPRRRLQPASSHGRRRRPGLIAPPLPR